MKGLLAFTAVVVALAIAAFSFTPVTAGQGNGAPNGGHYNLNIIGVTNDKSADFGGGNGGRIFVPLGSRDECKSTQILLSEGPFDVIDANGTDGSAAFQLPNPDPENDGVTSYSVFLRVLGKPNGKVTITTCATDPYDGAQVVSDLKVIEVRDSPAHGSNKFRNVSAELLYIYANVWDAQKQAYVYMRVPLFSPLLQDYLWQYDNNGLKLCQLRFYDVSTTVPSAADVQPK